MFSDVHLCLVSATISFPFFTFTRTPWLVALKDTLMRIMSWSEKGRRLGPLTSLVLVVLLLALALPHSVANQRDADEAPPTADQSDKRLYVRPICL